MLDKRATEMHEEVVRFHTEMVNLRSQNLALSAHVQSLERDLVEARSTAEALGRAHRDVLMQNGWYARAYASLLAPYRIATQAMMDGLDQAMKSAAKVQLTETIEETERLVTEAGNLRAAPDNPPQEYIPPKHQTGNEQ